MRATLQANRRVLLWSSGVLLAFLALFVTVLAPWAKAADADVRRQQTRAGASVPSLHDALDKEIVASNGSSRVQQVQLKRGVLTVRYRIRELPTASMQRTSALSDAKKVLSTATDSGVPASQIVVEATSPTSAPDISPDLRAVFDAHAARRIDPRQTRVEEVEAAARHLEVSDHLSPVPATPGPLTERSHT